MTLVERYANSPNAMLSTKTRQNNNTTTHNMGVVSKSTNWNRERQLSTPSKAQCPPTRPQLGPLASLPPNPLPMLEPLAALPRQP